MKAIGHVEISDEKGDAAEIKWVHKSCKGKMKTKGAKDVEGAGEDELSTVAYCEEASGDAVDNAARKRKKREKNENKNDRSEMTNTEQVEENGSRKWPEGESISGIKSSKELGEERTKKKVERNHGDEYSEKEGEKDGIKNKRKKKKIKLVKNDSDDMLDVQVQYEKNGKKRNQKFLGNGSNDPTPNKSNKKRRFSGLPILGGSNTMKWNAEEENLVRGKRFTHEEDKIVEEAVWTYILEHHLGDEGLNMVLNCKKYPLVRGCWKEIGSAIPYRPYSATYFRAQVLFRRSENRKWTQEEYDKILEYHEQHGPGWRVLADELGKHQGHVCSTWNRIKFHNLNRGHWLQEEYQKLFDMVNADLQSKVSKVKVKSSRCGMLRDNIHWTAISDQLSTRNQAACCNKWYKQLTSPMVREGVWADSDDYRLIDALYSLDATCMEDVDWDNLVPERPGDLCRKRWNQMAMHIGHHGRKSFAERVDILAQRYCPQILEVREAWDSLPRDP